MQWVNPQKSVCIVCGNESSNVPKVLQICPDCARSGEGLSHARDVHINIRKKWGLPGVPPSSKNGVNCRGCALECKIGENEVGFCGLRRNLDGKLVITAGRKKGLLHYYLDPMVTNCCSAWFCPGGTGQGFPEYARTKGPERGFYNLAVFFYSCNSSCLGCQNPSHLTKEGTLMSPEDLIEKSLASKVSCLCYFGGDGGGPQAVFGIRVSKGIMKNVKEPFRICWETNGLWNEILIQQAFSIAVQSGGNIKFDLKAPRGSKISEILNCVPNERAYRNFELLATSETMKAAQIDPLSVTTLLVPGFIDENEVDQIASYIADLNPQIPLSLLAFHPAHHLRDLPNTSREQAFRCLEAADRHLERVHLGNKHLLGL